MHFLWAGNDLDLYDRRRVNGENFLHADARERGADGERRARLGSMLARDHQTGERGLALVHLYFCARFYFFENFFGDHDSREKCYAANVFIFSIRSSMEIFTFMKYSLAPSCRAFSMSES